MSIGIPFGNYRLIRRIARGGMAEVFLAAQQGPGGFERTVAVKRILPHLADVSQFVGMFLDEARLAAQLSHPNIAHIYEFGRVRDSFFIAMEYIDGVDLSAVVLEGPARLLPLEHAARVIADVCAALHHAHNLKDKDGRPQGIVHRDISPQNIMVSFEGAVKVLDFGIAKAARHVERTQPGVVRGKFTYMSPEQVEGKRLDSRSDLFCTGIVLYELCTGSSLFPRNDAIGAMRRIRNADIPAPRREGRPLPRTLEKILLRSLTRDPDDRYASAAELQMDLEEYLRTASQISNSLMLAEYFRTNYGRPSSTEAQLAPAGPLAEGWPVERMVRMGEQAGAKPGTALARPRKVEQDTTLVEPRATWSGLLRDSDELDGPTQVQLEPQRVSASGTIHPGRSSPSLAGRADSGAPAIPLSSGQLITVQDPLLVPGEVIAMDSQLGPGGREDPTDPTETLIGPEELLSESEDTQDDAEERVGKELLRSARTGPQAPSLRASTTLTIRSARKRLILLGLACTIVVAGVVLGYLIALPGDDADLPLGSPGSVAADPGRGSKTGSAPRAPVTSLQSKPGTLILKTRPPGASIMVDGVGLATVSPIRTSLAAGPHRLTVSLKGYEQRTQRLRLEPGQPLGVSIVLRRLEPEEVVTLVTPDNGISGGRSGAAGHNPGPGRAPERGPRHKTGQSAGPRSATSGAIARHPGSGYLNITTIPWSQVRLGGRQIGITPLAKVSLPAGRHRLHFFNPETGLSVHQWVQVQPGQVTKIRLRLSPH